MLRFARLAGFARRKLVLGSVSTVLLLGGAGIWCVGCSTGGGAVPSQFKPQARVEKIDYTDWATVLKAVVDDQGFIRHELIQRNEGGTKDALYRFVGVIGEVSPLNRPDLFPDDKAKFAYWLNAYNALCLYDVQKRGLPDNVLHAGGLPGSVFFFDKFVVGGQQMTLDTMEKQYARSFKDPRVHFGLNCMSHSCPPLLNEPYVAERLDEQLSAQGRRYLNDPRGVVDKGNGVVGLGDIFTRFWKQDWIDDGKRRNNGQEVSLLDCLKPYAGPDSPVQKATKFEPIGYDWSLNRSKQ